MISLNGLIQQIFFFTFLICVFLNSCKTAKNTDSKKEISEFQVNSKTEKYIIDNNFPVAPNHCRIKGVIAGIDSSLRVNDPQNPCSKYFCKAIVRVDSVLGYGPAFANVLALGDEITVSFSFTLGPTSKDFFPNMKKFYPGLRLNDSFIADVESRIEPGNSYVYIIYGYTLLK